MPLSRTRTKTSEYRYRESPSLNDASLELLIMGHPAQQHPLPIMRCRKPLLHLPCACSRCPGTTCSLCFTHQALSWTSTSGRHFGSRPPASAGWSSPETSPATNPAYQHLHHAKLLCFLQSNFATRSHTGRRRIIILCPAVSVPMCRRCTAPLPVWSCLDTGPMSSVRGTGGTAHGKDIRLDCKSKYISI